MNNRGAMLVSLARERGFESISANSSEHFKKKKETKNSQLFANQKDKLLNEFDTENFTATAEYTPCFKNFKSVQDWVDAIPLIGPNDKNKKVKVLSNIILKNGSPIKQNNNNSLEIQVQMQDKKNISCYEHRGSTESIIPPTISSNELDIFSFIDDSIADPDYAPPSDEERTFDILRQEVIHYERDTNSNNIMHFDSSSDEPSPMLPIKSRNTENVSMEATTEETPIPTSNEEGVESVEKQNYKDRKDFCMFCEKDVSHFARHVTTWHSSEIEVARILSVKDPKQKRIEYSNLRKTGNFLRNRTNIKLRPVKRLKTGMATSTAKDFLPCKHCLGFYKKNHLYRHTKRCPQNVEVNLQKRQTAQSDGQTTLLLRTLLKHDQLLISELFPRMRADDIALIAKKDPLICQYAYSYIKGRRSKGNLDLVRQNVRRLAKLLKFVQKRNCNIKLLIDVLRPCHFKMIIDGVNEMAQYNHETEKYDSPTLAMNFGTLLKKCCDLAFVELLQKPNTNEQREDVNILKNLIVSQWADEVSAQAGTNLNENKWNKEELLPLTTDLKKLNSYLYNSAEQQYNKLKGNNDADAYYALKDILYGQILLLNRRRPAEVAQLKLHTYQTINLDSSKQDTEFQNCLTETEKILLKTYSRFIIRGKRGRGVPVLLSPTMRQHFELLVTVRGMFVKDNDYIFHTRGKGFIDGTKILRKYVEKCGITRIKSITATLLRKHLATITQLLQFSNNDMEQLSKFMGHTLKTHCNVYRMSDNIYQTAKVSKLLLLMMEGGAENFRGKQLDEIDIQLTPMVDNEDCFTQIIQDTSQFVKEVQQTDVKGKSHLADEKDRKVENKKIIERQSWTDEQKRIIMKHFAENIKRKEAPKQFEVKKFVELHSELFGERKWTSIKAVVYNIYTGKLKVK